MKLVSRFLLMPRSIKQMTVYTVEDVGKGEQLLI